MLAKVYLSLPPPPISLLSKISLIKVANTYFSHIRSFFFENKPQRRSSFCLSCAKLINKIFSQLYKLNDLKEKISHEEH